MDYREGRDIKLLEELKRLGLSLKFETLEVGDYVYGVICIERKSDDFLDFDHLYSQAQDMKMAYGDKAFLVVDCNLNQLIEKSKKFFHKDMTYSILGTVASLAVRLNLPPMFLSNKRYCAYVIKSMLIKANDDKTTHNVMAIRQKRTKKDRSKYILSGLPGVSLVLADRLLDKFKTPHGVFNASMEELMEVKKIGKTKAEKIYNAIRGE